VDACGAGDVLAAPNVDRFQMDASQSPFAASSGTEPRDPLEDGQGLESLRADWSERFRSFFVHDSLGAGFAIDRLLTVNEMRLATKKRASLDEAGFSTKLGLARRF